MILTSKALVLKQKNTPPQLEVITIEPPGIGEVRVRTVVSGVCHTDIAMVRDAKEHPMVLGHEGAGVVESVGEGVEYLKPGDPIVYSCRVPCGVCRRCQSGRQDLCESPMKTNAPRMHLLDGTPLHLLGEVGAFCEYVTLPVGGAVKIRPDIPLDRAALISCAVATGIGAALRSTKIEPGDAVVVIGTGGVGLIIIQGARMANAGMIIGIDLNERKLALARDFGATHTIRADQDDPIQTIMDLTHQRGVEHVFEVVGLPSLMEMGLNCLAVGGILLLVGGAPLDATFALHPRRLLSKQQDIRGCNYGSIRPALDFPLFADWYMQGTLKLDELLTNEIDLEQLPAMYHSHSSPDDIRTVVRFSER